MESLFMTVLTVPAYKQFGNDQKEAARRENSPDQLIAAGNSQMCNSWWSTCLGHLEHEFGAFLT